MLNRIERDRCRHFARAEPGPVLKRKGTRKQVQMGKMESSQYQYLKLNKYLLCCVGQWPYQTPLEKVLIGIVFLPIAVGQAAFQVQ